MASQDALERAPPIVTLTTDFGSADVYVGIMKGVILSRAPRTQIVDLSHEIQPQGVIEAAFLFESAWRFFPPGSIHVVVVDPGVGTDRRRLALAFDGHLFLGPDNGCLSGALPTSAKGRRQIGASYETTERPVPSAAVAVSIENELLLLQPISATFEGRDVFAPAAAHLARGGLIADLGSPIDRLVTFQQFEAPATEGGVDGRIMRADRFGNLITDIRASGLPAPPRFDVAGRKLSLVSTYAGADGVCAIAGSTGFIEIAAPKGNAAKLLGVGPGDRVTAGPA